MPRKQRKLNQAGFSIVEVVVMLFIIGVMLLLFQTTSNTVILNRYGRYKEIALRAADQKVQTMRTTVFASIPATGSFTDSQIESLPNGAGTITVTDEDETLKHVVVTITWRNPKGTGNQQIQLDTYISRGGLGQ
ncbi:MAG: hypothetical protein M3Q64_03395 [bacterium]|nr:hypothetical protein [bacterium]